MRWITIISLGSSLFLAAGLSGCADEIPQTPVDFAPANDSVAQQHAAEPPAKKAQNPVKVAPEDIVYFFNSLAVRDGVPDVDEGAKELEFEETESGLKYRILRASDGPKPTADDEVEVHYRGWLDNGEIFDASYGRVPFNSSLRGVIAGWTEGIPKVGKGGIIELYIPYQLGYGERGSGNVIPPKADLHFVVELLNIR